MLALTWPNSGVGFKDVQFTQSVCWNAITEILVKICHSAVWSEVGVGQECTSARSPAGWVPKVLFFEDFMGTFWVFLVALLPLNHTNTGSKCYPGELRGCYASLCAGQFSRPFVLGLKSTLEPRPPLWAAKTVIGALITIGKKYNFEFCRKNAAGMCYVWSLECFAWRFSPFCNLFALSSSECMLSKKTGHSML